MTQKFEINIQGVNHNLTVKELEFHKNEMEIALLHLRVDRIIKTAVENIFEDIKEVENV